MKTGIEHWLATFSLLPRLLVAAFMSYLYECYWLNPNQLLGYLWVLNKSGVSPSNVWNTLDVYTMPVRLLMNVFPAIIIWKAGRHFSELRPSCIRDVLRSAFWLSILYYVLDLTEVVTLNVHWQPHLHDHIGVFFKLFSILTVLYVKPGFGQKYEQSDKPNNSQGGLRVVPQREDQLTDVVLETLVQLSEGCVYKLLCCYLAVQARETSALAG